MNAQPHAKESQSWYWPDGRPAYEVPGAKGQPVTPDKRHALKYRLLPGVTRIIGVLAKPQLERWKQDQMMLAALTLPRHDNESDDSFLRRVREDSEAQASARAEEGKQIHKAIEQSLGGHPFDPKWTEHCIAVTKLLESLPPSFVADFKTKQSLEGKREKDVFYDEHIMQLAAYRQGFGMGVAPITGAEFICESTFASPLGYGGRLDVRSLVISQHCDLVSIAISVDEPGKLLHKVWTHDEASRGLALFNHALAIFKLRMQT